MSYDITKQKEVFRSKSGNNIIYEATCDGEPCYCLEHISSGRVALFDFDRRIYNLLRKDIDKRGAVTVYTNSGCCYFTIRIKGRNVPLSKYILLRHEKKSVYKIRNAKTKVSVIRQTDGVLHGCSIRTPKELNAAHGHKRVQRDFSMDNSHAMELLRLNAEQPEVFTPLVPIDKRGIPIDQLADMLSAYFGSTVEATATPANQN